MTLTIAHFKEDNAAFFASKKRIVLAYSGGLDSSVLLYLLVNTLNIDDVLLCHVNHGLQSCADDMEAFCQQQARDYQVAFLSTRLNLSHITQNIEAQARDARYAVLAKTLTAQSDVVLTAHHADDQLETLLLNMCRGSGVNGLRGIAKEGLVNGLSCYRPLLNVTQEELIAFAKQHYIKWFQDPSNELDYFDRNYMRHHITPVLKKRWPAVVQSFLRVSAYQKEAAVCLSELAELDISLCQQSSAFSAKKTLLIGKLKSLSLARQKNVIRYWFSLNHFLMSQRQLDELLRVLNAYVAGYKKVEAGHSFVALFKGMLFLVWPVELLSKQQVLSWLAEQSEAYVGRFNRHEYGVSSHFFKRQFQSSGVPPWLRNQVVFQLSQHNKLKHPIVMRVL